MVHIWHSSPQQGGEGGEERERERRGDAKRGEGTSTLSGSAPLATPYRSVPGFVIAIDAIEPTLMPLPPKISADTLTAGDACDVAAFVN
jgi:hypothetical protein